MHKKILTYFILFLPIGIFGIYLLSVYPGILTPDSLDQWNQIMTFKFSTWHPIFHTLINLTLIQIYKSPAIICIAQILALTLVNIYGFKKITKNKKIKKYTNLLLVLITVLITINPINGYMINTLWKDIFFSISFLLLIITYIDIILNKPELTKSKTILILILLFCVSALRYNGPPIAFIFITFYLCFTKKIEKTLFWTLGLILLLFFNNSILPKKILKIKNPEKPPITSNLIHYQLAIQRDGGKLDQQSIELLFKIDPSGNLKKNFSYYSTDYITYSQTTNKEFIKPKQKELLNNTIETIIYNPIIFIKNFFKMDSIIFYIKKPIDGYIATPPENTFDYSKEDTNLSKIYKQYNLKTTPIIYPTIIKSIYRFTIKHSNIFWNPSLFFYLNVLLLILVFLKNRNIKVISPLLLLIIPILITGIANPAQDFRYFYSLIISTPFTIIYSLIFLTKRPKSDIANSKQI